MYKFACPLFHTCSWQEELELFKADIDAAFRHVPIMKEHRQFAHAVFIVDGEIVVAGHNAMPFGSIASMHHWNRIGEVCL